MVPRSGITAPVVLDTGDGGLVIGDNRLEKVSYAEAREWFWVRTALWCVPAIIVSVIVSFAYYEPVVDLAQGRILYSIIAGVGSVVFGLIAAALSTQFPWMRLGKKRAWLLNAVLSTGMAVLGAVLLCGIILSVMRDNIENYPSQEIIATAYEVMIFAIALAGFWGFTLGSWFALRRDKYFVEQI
ncbi:MAG: hypothetical protein ACOX3G_10915 [Armatimonadota bacterium]